MACPLVALPMELLLNISSNLITTDLGSFRRSCKTIELSLRQDFALEFFTKKQFMLTYPSLKALNDIAEHPYFSKILKNVVIGLDRYKNRISRDIAGSSADENDKSYRFYKGREEQFFLIYSGGARNLLAKAFRNLPALQTVGLRDVNSRGRNRDGHNMPWHSYGAPTIVQETGHQMVMNSTFMNSQAEYPSLAFQILFHALGDAGAKPEIVEVFLRMSMAGLNADGFSMPPHLRPAMEPVLAGLKTVLLAVDGAFLNTHDSDGLHIFQQSRSDKFKRFLQACPNLTHLRLNFQNKSGIDAFLEWFVGCSGWELASKSPCQSQHVLPPEFPHLKTLDFGLADITPVIILLALKRYPTITSMSFWKVILRRAKTTDSTQLHTNLGRNLWEWLILQLSKTKLRHVKIGHVSQRKQDRGCDRVCFKKSGQRPLSAKELLYEVEHRGSDMEKYLATLAGDVVRLTKGFREAMVKDHAAYVAAANGEPLPDDGDAVNVEDNSDDVDDEVDDLEDSDDEDGYGLLDDDSEEEISDLEDE